MQLATKYYKDGGGTNLKTFSKARNTKSLSNWTKEEWGTKSGKNSTMKVKATGERYLPKKARAALSDAEYNT